MRERERERGKGERERERERRDGRERLKDRYVHDWEVTYLSVYKQLSE